MDSQQKGDFRRLLRATAVYAAAALAMLLPAVALVMEVSVVKDIPEGGVVESLQTSLLFLSAAAWARLAAVSRREGAGPARAFALVAFAALAMFVRELDGFFDDLLWHGAWAAIDAAVLAAAAALLLRRFGDTLRDLADFAATTQGLMAFCAILSAVAFSQLLGWKGVWRKVFDLEPWNAVRAGIRVYDYNVERHVKNVVEESLELFSYASLLVSAVAPRLLAGKPRPVPSGTAAK